jgi:phage tail sheath protein FI
MVSCDLVLIADTLQPRLRKMLAGRLPGFDLKKLFLNATHTHTGPVTRAIGWYTVDDKGVMKPPANEAVRSVLDLSLHIDEGPQDLLRREGVNLLQARVGKGIVVWGARTQCDDDLWRFVNVRRLIGYIGKQIQIDNQWAVFENNTQDLRATVARDVRYFLQDLWEKGALAGHAADQAFRVVCNVENNPQNFVDRGILVVDVWVNPVQTNEFVHLQLSYGDALVE